MPSVKFSGACRGSGAVVLYARSLDGKLAGFTNLPEGDEVAREVRAVVAPSSRISGRVVDHDGKPVANRGVQVRMDSTPDFATSGRFFRLIRTDEQGRYACEAVPAGSSGEVQVVSEDGGGRVTFEKFQAPGEDPISIPDLIIPDEAPKPATARPASPG